MTPETLIFVSIFALLAFRMVDERRKHKQWRERWELSRGQFRVQGCELDKARAWGQSPKQ